MTVIALLTWLITASAGLYLFAVWLIEYDREYQAAAATRLPIPVITTHVLLAVGGLVVWVIYLLTDKTTLAWTAVIMLGVVVSMGLIMAARWIGVRRAVAAGGDAAMLVPPERSFPVPVVVGHGVFAFATFVLVLLSALDTAHS